MSSVIKEFVVKFSANTKPMQESVKNLQKNMNSMVGSIGSLAGSLGVALGGMAIFKNLINAGDELQRFSSLTGIAAEDTGMLGNVLEKFGGNTQSAMSSLRNLQKAMHDATKGQGSLIEVQKEFGITLTSQNGKISNVKNTLLTLSDSFSKMSKQSALVAGQKLGLDESTILLLQQGRSAVTELLEKQRALGIITNEDAKDFKSFQDILIDLKQVFMKIALQLIKIVLPILKAVVSWITKFFNFINNNKRIVLSILAAIGLALTPILATLVKIAAASAVAFAPFFAVGAVVAAIALVIEDIWAYLQGADSVTGELVKKFPILGTIIKGIRNTIKTIVDFVKQIWEYFSNLTFDKLLGDISNLKNKLFNMLPSWLKPKEKGSKANTIPLIPSNKSDTISNITNNSNNKNVTLTQNIVTNNPKQLAESTNAYMLETLRNDVKMNSQR